MFKLFRCFVFGLGKENPAVIGLVIYEIHKVAVSKTIIGSHWALQSEHMTPPILSIGELEPLSF
jgi:hypothetical protein